MNKTLLTFVATLSIFGGLTMALPASARTAQDITTVGSCDDCEYSTIQGAINALGDAGYIQLENQNFTEDITIPAGDWTISGDVFDYDAVKIKGRVTIQKNAVVEFQYFNLNSTGKRYGMVIKGEATVKYGTVRKAGFANIYVPKSGALTTWELTVKDGNGHGILGTDRGWLDIEKATVKNNAKAGVRSNSARKVRLGNDCIVAGNKTGLYLKNHDNANSEVTSAIFKNNHVGVYLNNSSIYLGGATYRNNDIKKKVIN
ncbi:MAG: hypothetical protein CO132_04310 [Candidatus Kerfeldbacteria bacterium CG_4_9_14_3_um_filter_45_8]|nr:MAG: hypothetical protein CO132_04310 [Candidatus Kerfeldbacteria bacterium CG_4_9_14_3_um_filter_45_8]